MSNSMMMERIKTPKAKKYIITALASTFALATAAFDFTHGFEKINACTKIDKGLEQVLNGDDLKKLFKTVGNIKKLSIIVKPTAKDGSFTPFLYVFGGSECYPRKTEIKFPTIRP